MLGFLHKINNIERQEKLHYETFHWPELPDLVDIQHEYVRWHFDKNVRIDTLISCITKIMKTIKITIILGGLL